VVTKNSKSSPAFAVLRLANFPLQALLSIEPDLADTSVALLDGERKRALVIACTDIARTRGVEPGLTAPSALSRDPHVLLRQRHLGAEAEARAALLAVAQTLSPLVEDTAPGIATADLTALPADQRAARLHAAHARLTSLGFIPTAGLAPSPLLALYAAQNLSLTRARTPSSFSAPQSSTSQGLFPSPAPASIRNPKSTFPHFQPAPSPVQIIENVRAFLAPLPLSAADPIPEHVNILRLWGLRTLGDLTALAKADIAQRLGPEGLALYDRAAGETTRPLQPIAPPQTFTAQLELEFAIETLEPLLFLLRRFVDRLALDLRAAGLVAAELELTLTLDDEKTHQRTIRLPEPTAAPDLLYRTLESHLGTVQTDSPIVAAQLTLQPIRPLHRQHGLFDSSLRDPHGFAETLARSAALLGSHNIGTPQLTDTHRPDSHRLVPPAAVIPPAPPPAALSPLGLPLRRFRPPQPARVELADTTRAPAYVWTDKLQSPITAHRGPWRSNGDWWQPTQAWAREEWDIALPPPGGLYRLIETPSGWYLEGEYD
jgi:protein ImuB